MVCLWQRGQFKWWMVGLFLFFVGLYLGPILFAGAFGSPQETIDFRSPYFIPALIINTLPIVLFMVFILVVCVVVTWAAFRMGSFFNKELVYTLGENGVRLESPMVMIEARWEASPRVVENKKGFLLSFGGRTSFNWFPKSGFASLENIDQCRELFRKNVKDSRRLFVH
jgi:hypothetical protein